MRRLRFSPLLVLLAVLGQEHAQVDWPPLEPLEEVLGAASQRERPHVSLMVEAMM